MGEEERIRNTLQLLPRDGWFILLVDDDPTSLKLMERTLEDTYTVCTAASAEEAVDILHVGAPALVNLDLMMSDVSGIDVCKMMKTTKRLQDVPVILLSSCDRPLDTAWWLPFGSSITPVHD